jgi:putative DNA primase/helicase
VTVDVAARLSRGTAFPDGARSSVGDTIFLSAEDDAADTIRPRLDAAGADVSRVRRVKAVRVTLGDGAIGESVFSLERDLEKLDEAIGKIPDTQLLVIDPVSAYMGRVDTHRDAEIRRVLAPLADLASRRRVAVVGVMHLKKGDTTALLRVSGSIGFVAAARVVWGFGEDPDVPETRIMVAVKNNLAPLGNGLAYRIEADGASPRIVWQQGAVTLLLWNIGYMSRCARASSE